MKERSVLQHLKAYHPGQKIPGSIKLSSNENPLGTSPRALEALRALTESTTGVSIYPDGAGIELRERIVQTIGLARYDMNADNVVLGNGSDEVLVMTAAAYLDPGSTVVIGEHTFSQYEFASRMFDARILRTPMPAGRFNLDNTIEAAGGKNRETGTIARIVFICNPNNPTGTYLSHPEIETILKEVPADTLIVLDEAYREYVTASDFPDTLSLASRYENLLVLRTFSKIYGLAGLRIGYGYGSRRIIQALEKVKPPFNTSLAAQAAALAALRDAEFFRRSTEMNALGKDQYYRALDTGLAERRGSLGIEIPDDPLVVPSETGMRYHPTQANFICLELPCSSREVYDALNARGFTVRRLDSFGLPNAVRITISTEQHNTQILSALADWAAGRSSSA
jgi:histidinol-phosphate aminotransferase